MTGQDEQKDIGPVTTRRHGVWSRLYHGETNADIVSRWKLWFALSGVLLLIGGATLFVNGLNLGIDFSGGTIWKTSAGKATVAQVQDAMADLGYEDVQVQEVTEVSGGKDVRQIQVEAETSAEPASATTTALNKATADLDDVRGTVPKDAKRSFDRVYGNLSELNGPFRKDVPAELTSLQKELDGLPAALKKAKGDDKVTVAKASASRMERQVEALGDLEAAERSRISQDVTKRLSELTGTPVEQITVDTVGPSWGKQISEKAQTALIVFLLAIMLFITIRFEFKMAVATIVALFHDLLMVVGLYALFGFPVTPSTVVALLTMLGFSIYDGIVVFDRVNENTKLLTKRSKMTYTDMANTSLNQVLMRSLNTSITTLLPILSVLIVGSFILGADTLEEFGLALFLGLMSGAYSSIFIATPLLALLKEREPRFRELRRQIEERGHGSVDLSEPEDEDPVKEAVLATGHAPRPRKQGRRR
ncbi:MAG: protein translocase subunit SecF [Acidimicrobiales bacterium]|nr:protein translocase subunit SecF [Acidimicrobiales bacterium]